MYSSILLPIDPSQEASWQKALPVAVQLAETFDAALHLITVVPGFNMAVVEQYFPPEAHRRMIEEARGSLEGFIRDHVPEGRHADATVAEGRIYEEILAAAESVGADLIVMGSHAPELKDYLLGPNAARVVRHAPVSVMVVR